MRMSWPCTRPFPRRWRETSADEAWEIWKFPYPAPDRPHWFVILSQSAWCENEQNQVVNGLLCSTLRPPGRELKAHEVRLDSADGMDWDTVVKCSHVHE